MQRLALRVGLVLVLVLTGAPGWAQMQETNEESAASTSTLKIAEHHFGLEVVEREIHNEIDTFHKGDVVFLWMRVEGGPSDPILVTWSIDTFQYDVELGIGAASWRTWARKTLFRAGEWTVRVADAAGNVLLEEKLMVEDAPRPDGE